MIWSVQNEWPSGAQIISNCYRHWATIVLKDLENGSGHFLHSKESVTQGGPLSMIVYSSPKIS